MFLSGLAGFVPGCRSMGDGYGSYGSYGGYQPGPPKVIGGVDIFCVCKWVFPKIGVPPNHPF